MVSLIAAAEREGKAMGAVIFIAACAPFQCAKLGALQSAGYGVVTLYLVKHRLVNQPSPASVRAAVPADVPAIVAMGAQSQQVLFAANPKMWTPHPDAPARFSAWMLFSLNLPDRRIFVSPEPERAGFVIAQPASPMRLPLTCKREHVGLVDDFWTPEFAATDKFGYSTARDLLTTAEQEFVQRGRTSAMVICADGCRSKQDFLRHADYRDGNAWLLKA